MTGRGRGRGLATAAARAAVRMLRARPSQRACTAPGRTGGRAVTRMWPVAAAGRDMHPVTTMGSACRCMHAALGSPSLAWPSGHNKTHFQTANTGPASAATTQNECRFTLDPMRTGVVVVDRSCPCAVPGRKEAVPDAISRCRRVSSGLEASCSSALSARACSNARSTLLLLTALSSWSPSCRRDEACAPVTEPCALAPLTVAPKPPAARQHH